jgi:acylglycerol lipase
MLNYILRRCSGQALGRKSNIVGVVATSPAIRVANPLPAVQVALAKVMNKLQPGMQMANGLALDGLARDPAVIRAYTGDPLVHNKISVRLALACCRRASGHWNTPPSSRSRLLLVHGTADKLTSAPASQQFAAKVRGDCTLKLWEGFYHETYNEPEKGESWSSWWIGCGSICRSCP